MAGHTPGPWRVEAAGFGPVGGWTISDEANGFGLCTRSPWPNRAEESAANARLIASAPELLEAVEGLLKLYDEERAVIDVDADAHCPECTLGTTPDSFGRKTCAYHIARAAISKATGQ